MRFVFLFLLVVFQLVSATIIAQTEEIDSLITALKKQNERDQANTNIELSNAFFKLDLGKAEDYTIKGLELAIKYSLKKEEGDANHQLGRISSRIPDYELSIEYHKKALAIREELDDKEGMSKSLTNIGSNYTELGEFDKAIEYFEKSLPLKKEVKDDKGLGITIYNLGNVYTNKGNFEKAINCYQEAQNIFEKIDYQAGLASVLNCNGLIYEKWDNKERALEFYLKAMEINEALGNLVEVANQHNNIGNIFSADLARKDTNYYDALEHYEKAFEIREKINDKAGICSALQNIAITYTALQQFDKALPYYERSLKSAREIDNKTTIVYILSAIGNNYKTVNDMGKAIQYLNESLNIALEIGQSDLIIANYDYLQQAYERDGDYKNSLKSYQNWVKLKDSIYRIDKFAQINEMQTKYETEKKEAQLLLQNLEIENQAKVNKKQRIIIIGAITAFVVIFFFAIMLLRMFRAKKKANVLLAHQNEEIRLKSEEITAQRDEIETQRDEIMIQRDKIEIIHEELTDSIHYAERIQRAILPNEEFYNQLTREIFILFKPKDVVSGDFYWATKIKRWLIITAADCTGHGVPGAFMSMLGVAFLNDIVRKEDVKQASHVLDHLRLNIIESLQQKGVSGEQKDGMDMSLIAIEDETNIMQYAGANNPMWMIRKDIILQIPSMENADEAVEEIKADKMPVAIYDIMSPYTNHVIQMNPGDTVYLFSDGFPDQFGGPKGKKFKYKPFKQILAGNSHLTMEEQRVKLDIEIENWKSFTDPVSGNPFEQIDDIVIIGLKV